MSAYDYAANPDAAPVWNIFGLEVAQVGYQGQVVPVLIAAFIIAKTENFLKRIRLEGDSASSIKMTTFETFQSAKHSPINYLI